MKAKIIHVKNPMNKNAPQDQQEWTATLEDENGDQSTITLSAGDVKLLWQTGAPISPFYAKVDGFIPQGFAIETGPPMRMATAKGCTYTLES